MSSTTLYQLNEYVRRVIKLNFQESIWLKCEISQISKVKGQVYLDVIEHDEKSDLIIAKASAVIWYKSYLFIQNKLKNLLPSILKQGSEILIKVHVEFHEKFGLKLSILDIDPTYSIGKQEMLKMEIIERLKNNNLIEKNQLLSLPIVLQTIAIISSSSAAGYHDFVNQIISNEYKYRFKTKLFSASMQGKNTSREICQAIQTIHDSQTNFDCIVIIRGGGSKVDLSAFDDYQIGNAIANSSYPIITGIGHEIDTSVADMVAHTNLKTPTAVAAFIVDRNADFEASILTNFQKYLQTTNSLIINYKTTLNQVSSSLHLRSSHAIVDKKNKLNTYVSIIQNTIHHKINNQIKTLEHIKSLIQYANPENLKAKGYALVRKNGKYIYTSKNHSKEELLDVEFYDGILRTEIK